MNNLKLRHNKAGVPHGLRASYANVKEAHSALARYCGLNSTEMTVHERGGYCLYLLNPALADNVDYLCLIQMPLKRRRSDGRQYYYVFTSELEKFK